MKQLVTNLIGLLAGLVCGFVLLPEPILARFASTHVTWDGSQCPAGSYTITSTASNLFTGESFQTTSPHVRLPLNSVGQDFSNLPPGMYLVTARSVDLEGTAFVSDEQHVTVAVSTSLPTPLPGSAAPGISSGSISGHRRPTSSPPAGTAQARPPSAIPVKQVGGPRSAGQAVEFESRSIARGVAAEPASPVPSWAAQVQAEVSLAWALETLDQLATAAPGGGSAVRHVDLVDEDGDGAIDYVRAIIRGRVLVWRIK